MAKVPVTDLPIFVYTCTSHEDRPAKAFIGDLPVVINAPTPARAMIAAKNFVKEEAAKAQKRKAKK